MVEKSSFTDRVCARRVAVLERRLLVSSVGLRLERLLSVRWPHLRLRRPGAGSDHRECASRITTGWILRGTDRWNARIANARGTGGFSSRPWTDGYFSSGWANLANARPGVILGHLVERSEERRVGKEGR